MSTWKCDLGNGQFDHDWQFHSDWSGDPEVVGGTFDCSYWECRVCGERDGKRPPPQPSPENDE